MPAVVELSKKYLRCICGEAFEDPRTNLVITDGVAFMAEEGPLYDVIIIDSTDPVGPGEQLFSDAFYASCHKRLTPGGILVTQNGVPFLQAGELKNSVAAMKRLFKDGGCYLATVPTYVGGPMAFGWATDNESLRHVSVETLSERFTASGIETRYYTPEVHLAAFALPRYIADLIA